VRPALVLGSSLAALACVTVGACGQPSEAPAENGTSATEAVPAAPATDATVAGTGFNATATVPCTHGAGQPTSGCEAGVVRESDGTAIVTVNWPGSGSRAIFFDAQGKPIGFDANEADGSAAFELKATRNADLNLISIAEERYEIPDALVAGD
jgi:hypothetical protein